MSEKKSVVVGAEFHFRGSSYFAFEYNGDVTDIDAMKEAAWAAYGSDTTLQPLEVTDHEYVDDEQNNQSVEVWVEEGTVDDYRAPPPKAKTKAQLWRRVARFAGELTFISPNSGVFDVERWTCGDSAVKNLIATAAEWGSYGRTREHKRCVKLVAKLEAAFAAWTAAP